MSHGFDCPHCGANCGDCGHRRYHDWQQFQVKLEIETAITKIERKLRLFLDDEKRVRTSQADG